VYDFLAHEDEWDELKLELSGSVGFWIDERKS
jgi:hypothetical protein